MKALERYALRRERERYLFRAWRKGRSLARVADRTGAIRPADVLCFVTLRNERPRLPYFLAYYRDRGVSHFVIVDNDSTDGSRDYLAAQPDCSVWTTPDSYRHARFGMDCMNRLLRLHGTGHWCLTVDADEFLVYPFSDTRPLPALCDWLEASSIKSFGAMLLDMYPKGPVSAQGTAEGQNPFESACWFDAGNYTIERNWTYGNLWIQGGPRARMFFADAPERAPALNKIPLVRWRKGYAYASSTHMLLPRGLNLVFDEWGGEKASGVLLHAKFQASFAEKAAEEMERRQHYADSAEYRAYHQAPGRDADLWTRWSERYINWRQLEILGLMSKGNWA
jgi:hypothetical protein